MEKTYVDNSRYLEAICDIAEKIVHERFGEAAVVFDGDTGGYTEEAQDLFNETYDTIEGILQNTLGIHSEEELLDNH